MKRDLFWDLETISQSPEKIYASLPDWSIEEAMTRLPKTHKLKATVDAWLENDRLNYGQDVLDRAALNADTAIIAISGMITPRGMEQLHSKTATEELEPEVLVETIDRLDDYENIFVWNLQFDMKMLVQRCWLRGIAVPRSIYNPLARYPIPERFVCLMEKWGVSKGASYSKLGNVAKALGLEGKTGDGKDFGKLWAEDPVKALEYNAQDLRTLQAVAGRMGCA